MILVRTNPKLALVIVCLTLLTSILTVYMVTRSTDKAVERGAALQQQATQTVNDAIKESTAAASGAQADTAAAVKAAAAEQLAAAGQE